jgi:RNA polymerase sigma-70 factor, ECF subfamily
MRTTSQSMPATEASLLDRVATGEAEALRECVARHGGLVWSLARRFEPDEAEEAVQEVFLDLWKSAAYHDPRIASEAAFIAMVARRRLIERRRSRHSHRAASPSPFATAEPLVQGDATADPSSAAEAVTAARALTALRPEQRQVLVLAASRGLSHPQIAAETGLSLAAVKAHVRRGLLSIRAALWGVDRESP